MKVAAIYLLNVCFYKILIISYMSGMIVFLSRLRMDFTNL